MIIAVSTISCKDTSKDVPVESKNKHSIPELIEMIMLKAEDFDKNNNINTEKRDVIKKASVELKQRGDAAIPPLVELTKMILLSTIHESETGSTALSILVSIGDPVISYLHKNKSLPEDLHNHIIKAIESEKVNNK